MRVSTLLKALLATLVLFSVPASAMNETAFNAELLSIQQAWARTNYETPAGNAREQAFDQLEKRAGKFVQQNPGRAEPLIWQAIIESSYAGAKGGIGALGLCKAARSNLEAAMKIDPNALDGSAYTSLGTLYYKVPGFPLGFGDHDKARKFLRKALEINPNGIDPNYFYAEFLYEEGEFAQALQYLDKAAKAPSRPGRESADKGRRAEIVALAAKARKEAG